MLALSIYNGDDDGRHHFCAVVRMEECIQLAFSGTSVELPPSETVDLTDLTALLNHQK